jgi:hypothetical protein
MINKNTRDINFSKGFSPFGIQGKFGGMSAQIVEKINKIIIDK